MGGVSNRIDVVFVVLVEEGEDADVDVDEVAVST